MCSPRGLTDRTILPDAAKRVGDEGDIEEHGRGPCVEEWPVLRTEGTLHLWFYSFVLCRVCEALCEALCEANPA